MAKGVRNQVGQDLSQAFLVAAYEARFVGNNDLDVRALYTCPRELHLLANQRGQIEAQRADLKLMASELRRIAEIAGEPGKRLRRGQDARARSSPRLIGQIGPLQQLRVDANGS